MLLKNAENRFQLKQLIIRLSKYNISTNFVYKQYIKEKLGDFRVYITIQDSELGQEKNLIQSLHKRT